MRPMMKEFALDDSRDGVMQGSIRLGGPVLPTLTPMKIAHGT